MSARRARAGGARRRPGDAELCAALARLGGGGAAPLELVARSALACRSTYPLERLRLRRRRGGELDLVFKDLGRGGGAPGARRARFVDDPLREIAVYRDVLPRRALATPGFFGAVVAGAGTRRWLFLERVDGAPLWQAGGVETFVLAAEWLARLHARYSGATGELPRRLLSLDGAHYRRWLARAERFSRRAARLPQALPSRPRLRRRVRAAAAWLDGAPRTLVHGEFYPANILVERGARGERIRPVDWEMAGVGCGLLDLAALVSGRWSEAERATLVAAYREALPRRQRPAPAALGDGLEHCRLLVAVQWLGWSPEWTPPPEQACDWSAVARSLVDERSVTDRPPPRPSPGGEGGAR